MVQNAMIIPAQSRAARAFLNWTLDDLAKASGLSRTSLNTFEQGASNAKAETYRSIQNAFEKAGIEFTAEPGVRMRGQRLEVRRWEGENIIEQLLDDIFNSCAVTGGEVLFSGFDERSFEFAAATPDLNRIQIKRFRQHGITERVILCENDAHFTFPPDVTTYRWITPEFFALVPTITYANKHAIIVYGPPLSMVVTENHQVAQMYRQQFEILWNEAKIIPFTNDQIIEICNKNLPLDGQN